MKEAKPMFQKVVDYLCCRDEAKEHVQVVVNAEIKLNLA